MPSAWKATHTEHVAAWFRARTEALYLSTISAAEIERGIAKLRRTGSGQRADNLRQWFDRILGDYADRLLPFDLAAARIAGVLGDSAQADGPYPGLLADVAIAAIAKSRELVTVTLNLRPFEPLGVDTLNPFGRVDLLSPNVVAHMMMYDRPSL